MFWAFIGSIAGGIISSRAQKKAQKREMAYHDKVRRQQDAREDTKIQRMAKDARAAGLNPVTALRSGAFGMVGYQAPVFSSFSNSGGMGDAVARAFSALDNIPTRQQKLRETMELELLGAQIKNINQRTAYYSGFGQTPQANVTDYVVYGSKEWAERRRLERENYLPIDWVFGGSVQAETVEKYYGEIPAEFEGASIYVEDFVRYKTGSLASFTHVPLVNPRKLRERQKLLQFQEYEPSVKRSRPMRLNPILRR